MLEEDPNKKKRNADPQLRLKYENDDIKWRVEVDKLLGVLNSTTFVGIDKKRSRKGRRSDPFSKLSTTMGKIKRTQVEKESSLQ